MRWEPTACQAGDMVRIRLGSVYHYGIFVSEDEVIQFGLPPTAENRAEQRRRIPPSETVARARARLGEGGYNLIHNNCEHFVNECVFGESRCTQEEDVRSRWLNRPICDVYVARIPETVGAEGIYPEKRRAEIESIVSEDLRRNARFLWQLLGVPRSIPFTFPCRKPDSSAVSAANGSATNSILPCAPKTAWRSRWCPTPPCRSG